MRRELIMKSRLASYLIVSGLLLTMASCNTSDSYGTKSTMAKTDDMPTAPTTGPDGTLALPADYKSWPKFLVEIPKAEPKQVRDIYINHTGARTSAGQPFPNGTVMVMEIYKAKMDGDKLATTMDGKLIKSNLAKVFVMGKNEGWGATVAEPLKTGDWIYSAYDPAGKPLMEDFTKCRACHAPLAQKDFVHRYDEYFEKRGRM